MPARHDRRIYLAARGEGDERQGRAPVAAKDWFDSQRGWILEPMSFVQKADSLSEAVRWGGQETIDAAFVVYRTLHSVEHGKISVRNFAGPGPS